MAQGKALSDIQEESLRQSFSMNDDVIDAAQSAGCSLSTAKARYRRLRESPPDDLAQLRLQKKIDIVERMAEVRLKLVDALADEAKIAEASLRDVATSVGILTDKIQVMTGGSTSNVTLSGTVNHRDMSGFTDQQIDALAAIAEQVKSGALAS